MDLLDIQCARLLTQFAQDFDHITGIKPIGDETELFGWFIDSASDITEIRTDIEEDMAMLHVPSSGTDNTAYQIGPVGNEFSGMADDMIISTLIR